MNAQTQYRQRSDNRPQQQTQAREVAVIERLQQARLPITESLAEKFGINEGQWRVLIDQVFPSAKSVEAVSMALTYCKARNLDIFKKPVHIVPMYSSALRRMVETVWPGISEIRTTAARTHEYAGIDEAVFGPSVTLKFARTGQDERGESFKIEKEITFPEWCKVTVYRVVKGEPRAFHAKVFWREAYATEARGSDVPNEMWAKRPFGQIEKVAEAAALRKAFPEEIGNEYAAEEMAGRVIDTAEADDPRDVTPAATVAKLTPPKPPAPPAPPAPSAKAAATLEAEPVVEVTDGFVLGDFLEQIETGLAGAKDEADVEQIWSDFDAPATLETEGHADMIDTAFAIRDRRLAQLAPLNGG